MNDEYKQKVFRILAERNLSCFMNNTKWRELQNAVDTLQFPPPLMLKSLLDEYDSLACNRFETDEITYIGDWSDESFLWGAFDLVEWIKVRPVLFKYRGRLVPHEKIDESIEFESILKQYNIPFEFENGIYTIYGYK